MQRTPFDGMNCSIARTWHVVGEAWTPLILRDIYVGMRRFETLQEDLGVARNILTDRLRRLVDAGLLQREPYRDGDRGRTRYEYSLTESGLDLVPIIMALMAWGDRWTASAAAPPMLLRHDACGRFMTPTVCCSECGERVDARAVTAVAGPGGRAGPGTQRIGEFVAPAGRHKP